MDEFHINLALENPPCEIKFYPFSEMSQNCAYILRIPFSALKNNWYQYFRNLFSLRELVGDSTTLSAGAVSGGESPGPSPRVDLSKPQLRRPRDLQLPLGLPADGSSGIGLPEQRPLVGKSAAVPAGALSASAGAAQRPHPRDGRPVALGRPIRCRQRRPVWLRRVLPTHWGTHNCVHRAWILVALDTLL